ncbi:MAG: metal ABC transporter substrate-binding protein [Ruminococcus sp.]|nr:metal ABC transporter substrate-binding protein [Ruminococcus sp.]
MLKKFIAVLIPAIALLTGCNFRLPQNDGKINIVCTVFPYYDWTRQIVGDSDNINITYLLKNGADIHSFQPTADDIIRISDCDIFIYTGGESDEWIENVLANAQNKNMKILNMLDIIADSAIEEEIKEGMDGKHNHDDGHDTEYDEHIWLSLNNAEKCVSEIWKVLYYADKENSALYTDNANQYIDEIKNLDNDFHTLFDNNPQTLIFGDRFPFRYFTEDYGLDYYAAFSGCSAETQASFKTITFLSRKIDELNSGTVFTIENSDCSIADSIIANTKSQSQNTAVLDSIQSVNSAQIEDGTTYLGIMNKNYNILNEALK